MPLRQHVCNTKNRFSVLEGLDDFPDIETNAKRKRKETIEKTVHNEKYIIISHAEPDKNLNKISCFGIDKALEMITSKENILEVQRLRSGELLIISKNEKSTKAFLNAKTLGGLAPIKVQEHPYLNKSKGIVFSREFTDLNETEIKDGLQDQNVVDVYKIKRKLNGEFINTAGHILTFDTPYVPSSIKAGFLNLKVRIYIPNPLRCTICQRYGHSKKNVRLFQDVTLVQNRYQNLILKNAQ